MEEKLIVVSGAKSHCLIDGVILRWLLIKNKNYLVGAKQWNTAIPLK
jgi:hypothetical protein